MVEKFDRKRFLSQGHYLDYKPSGAGFGPAFSAYRSGASQGPVSAAMWVQVQLNSEEGDTASCFDTSTYRFTPNKAGWYRLNGQIRITCDGAPGLTYVGIAIKKNGSFVKSGEYLMVPTGDTQLAWIVRVNALVYFNGTTDYAELFGYWQGGGNGWFYTGADYTFFDGNQVA